MSCVPSSVVSVGASIGWLFARGLYGLNYHEEMLVKAGANCVELDLNDWERVNGRISVLCDRDRFLRHEVLPYRSLHAPDFTENINAFPPETQITKMMEIIQRHFISTVVICPHKLAGHGDYPISYYTDALSADIPLAFKNQGGTAESGFVLGDLDRLVKKLGTGFVLDVQHAYEQDGGMSYAVDLFNMVADRLCHLHASGRSAENNRALVHKSSNAGAIVKFLGKILSKKRVPLIITGDWQTVRELAQEIDFLKKELGLP